MTMVLAMAWENGLAQTIITDDSTYTSGQPSSVLDVKSKTKGVLIPRVDFNDRPTTNLTTGLLIYVIANGPLGNNLYYYYDGAAWVKLATGTGSQWITSGSDIYYNSGKVGIGTILPGSELDVKGTLRLSGLVSGFIGLQSPSSATSYTLTFPNSAGLGGQILSTTGGGNLSWLTPGINSITSLQDSLNDRYRRKDTASVLLSKTRATHDYAPIAHNQGISTINNLQDSLNNRYRRADTASVLLGRTRASHDYETKINAGTTAQYWRGDKTWQTLGITTIPSLQDSLNDRYRRKDTASVLLSKTRATHDYAPIAHNQGISTITGLQDSLSNRYRRADTASVLLSRTRAGHEYETKINIGTTAQYWRGDKTWQTLGITTIPSLQDSLNDRYRRKDTASVLLSKTRATHDYAPISHNQGISTITGLQDSLSNRYRRADTASVLLSRTRAGHDYETKILNGTTAQYWRGDKTWQNLNINIVPALQDSLNDRYRRADTASVLLSKTRASHDYETKIGTGTTSQYYRGDKTWKALNKSAVGLGNVDNTSDLNKPVSTAQQAALNLKANLDSPIFTGTPSAPTPPLGSNNTQVATTEFVSLSVPDATTTVKGKVQLAGDLTGTADAPVIGNGKITRAKIANTSVNFAKIQNVSSSSLLGRATSGAGVIEEISLGTGLSFSGTTLNANSSNRWSLLGNSGTNSDSNFIGTTDSVALHFRVNNLKAGRIGVGSVDGTVILGYEAGNNDSTAKFNTIIGYRAGVTLNSNYNTLVGKEAGSSITTGVRSTAIGVNALQYNRTGDNNTAIGYGADVTKRGLNNSTAIGYNAKVDEDNKVQIGNNNITNVKLGDGTTPTLETGALIANSIQTYSLQLIDGNQAKYKVLTSDDSGQASWEYAEVADATTFSKGKIQLAGDLGGTGSTASTPVISDNAVTTSKVSDASITYSKIQNTNASDIVLGRVSPGSGVLEEVSTTGSGNVVRAASPTLSGTITAEHQALSGTLIVSTNAAVGTSSPEASAVLDVSSTTQGFLPPRMSYAQIMAISSPVAGLIIWCNNCGTSGEVQVFNGTTWTNMCGGGASGALPALDATATVTDITMTTATSGGNVTSDGGSSVTERGVCWSTTSGPTIADSKTSDGSGTGSFSSSLTGLTASTLYYVRAFATNSTGTSYGLEVSFATASTSLSLTFTDGGQRGYIDIEDGASISVNGLVYIFGGYENHTAGAPYLWTYDLAADTWTQKTNAPIGRTEVPLAYNSSDGKIYTFGGNIAGDDYNNLHRYNIATDTWELVVWPVPGISERRSCSLGILNDKVYIIGGWEDSPGYLTDSYCYDLNTGITTSISPLPNPTAWGRMFCQVGNYIYIAGGNNDSGTVKYLQRYDMSTDTWVQLAEMPEARASASPLLYYNNSLWILSGGNQTTCLRYDISTDSWSTYSSNIIARSNHWAGVSTTGKSMVWGPDNTTTQVCQLP